MPGTPCPNCSSPYGYADGNVMICPECAHQWSTHPGIESTETAVVDAHGAALADGDNVVVIKDLKVKGSSAVVKQGTRVKNIKLVQNGDHNLSCRIDGIGAMDLKSEFVKKN